MLRPCHTAEQRHVIQGCFLQDAPEQFTSTSAACGCREFVLQTDDIVLFLLSNIRKYANETRKKLGENFVSEPEARQSMFDLLENGFCQKTSSLQTCAVMFSRSGA